ncbi:MAG TPA: DUF2480 family protein [Flavobacterium sp.]|nr:DUF2480 family protein [Flavobacterium sp.]
MDSEIVNRVAASALEVFDLEDYYPDGRRISLDLAQWLEEGLLLREKPFREALKNHDWSPYQNAYVALFCSTDAIVPAWATILVATHLNDYARRVVSGSLEDIDTELYAEILPQIDYEAYRDKPVIIKGCSRKPVPTSAYLMAASHLQRVAKSIMYGEACSAVPLYKRKS